MKKQLIQSVKIITLALLIGLGAQYIMAAAGGGGSSQAGIWTGPAGAPPTQNKGAPINVTAQGQAKNTSPLTGVTLNIGGLFAADNISSFGYVASGDLSQANNGSATYPAHVCADTNGKLILCNDVVTGPSTKTQVYSFVGGKQVTSGPCTACTDTTFVPDAGVSVITVSMWGAGGAGGNAAIARSNSSMAQASEATGSDGGPSRFSGTGGVSLLANGGSGGKGGKSKCPSLANGSCPYSLVGVTLSGLGGIGGSASGAGQDGSKGEDSVSTQAYIGGAGGGGEAGEYLQQTIAIPSGGSYSVVVGPAGQNQGAIFSSAAVVGSGNGVVCPTTGGGAGGTTGFLQKFINTAYAAANAAVGGNGGIATNSASHGNAGNGGSGGSNEICSGTTSFASVNIGDLGKAGRVEVTWTN